MNSFIFKNKQNVSKGGKKESSFVRELNCFVDNVNCKNRNEFESNENEKVVVLKGEGFSFPTFIESLEMQVFGSGLKNFLFQG
jgi:hypothetical protein